MTETQTGQGKALGLLAVLIDENPDAKLTVVIKLTRPWSELSPGDRAHLKRSLRGVGFESQHLVQELWVEAAGSGREIAHALGEPLVESAYLNDWLASPEKYTYPDPAFPGPGAGETEAGPDRPIAREVMGVMKAAAAQTGASSFMLFVRDVWSSRFHLRLHDGHDYVEPLAGWEAVGVSAAVIEDEAHDSTLSRTAASSPNCCQEPVGRRAVGAKADWAQAAGRLKWLNPLFAAYRRREGIRSFVRLLVPATDGGETVAAVCFNYGHTHGADPVAGTFDDVKRIVAAEHRRLDEESHSAGEPRLTAVLGVMQTSHESPVGPWARLAEHVGPTLRTALHLLTAGRPGRAFVSFHQFFSDSGRLDLFDAVGQLDRREGCASQDVGRGEGVISWVALRGQGVVIRDLRRSPFGAVHRQVSDPPTRSELAVPVVGPDGGLVGVLNAESSEVGAFDPWHFQALTALADRLGQLVSMFRLTRSELIRRAFTGLTSDVVGGVHPHELARSLCALFVADYVHVLERGANGFRAIGMHDRRAAGPGDPLPGGPRVGGWTEHVSKSGRWIWLCGVGRETVRTALYWSDGKGQWLHGTELGKDERWLYDSQPPEPNPDVEPQVDCELGIPLGHTGAKTLVAWVKYKREAAEVGHRGWDRRVAARGETLTTVTVPVGAGDTWREELVPMPWLMIQNTSPSPGRPRSDVESVVGDRSVTLRDAVDKVPPLTPEGRENVPEPPPAITQMNA